MAQEQPVTERTITKLSTNGIHCSHSLVVNQFIPGKIWHTRVDNMEVEASCVERFQKCGNTLCEDHKKKKGCRGDHYGVLPGITIQSKFKTLRMEEAVVQGLPKSTLKATWIVYENAHSAFSFSNATEQRRLDEGRGGAAVGTGAQLPWSGRNVCNSLLVSGGASFGARPLGSHAARSLRPLPATWTVHAPASAPQADSPFQPRGRQGQEPLSPDVTKH